MFRRPGALGLRVRALFATLFLNRVLSDCKIPTETLVSLLRRYPYWLSGHLFLGERSLREKEIGRAYACSQAILSASIPGSQSHKKEASFLMARCHLAKGDAAVALQLFEKWVADHSATSLAHEEIAACLMALNRLPEAKSKLEAIAPDKRSQEARAALLFLQNKLEDAAG